MIRAPSLPAARAMVAAVSLASLVALAAPVFGMTPGSGPDDVRRVLALVDAIRAHRADKCGTDTECDESAIRHGLSPALLWEREIDLLRACNGGDDEACDYVDALNCVDGGECPALPCADVCRAPMDGTDD